MTHSIWQDKKKKKKKKYFLSHLLVDFSINWWSYSFCCITHVPFRFSVWSWPLLMAFSLPCTPCLLSFCNLWHTLYTHFLLPLPLLHMFLLSQLLNRFATFQIDSKPVLVTASLSDNIPLFMRDSAPSLNSHILPWIHFPAWPPAFFLEQGAVISVQHSGLSWLLGSVRFTHFLRLTIWFQFPDWKISIGHDSSSEVWSSTGGRWHLAFFC